MSDMMCRDAETEVSLGDRMKMYEGVSKTFLPRKSYVILRLDGCHFHTFTKGFNKPFDSRIRQAMVAAAIDLVNGIQGAKFAYHQSDEISVLLTDFDTDKTEAWYQNAVQKITSVAASMCSVSFNWKLFSLMREQTYDPRAWEPGVHPAYFDARAFELPNKTEVMNYFLWRIQDAERNSVAGLAQSLYSHKELMGVKKEDQKQMCLEKGVSWEDLPYWDKRGSIIPRANSTGVSAPPTPQEKELLLPFIPDRPGDLIGELR